MPSQIEKLEAHASHLLDEFIRLRERYALLDPMLFREEVPKLRGSGKQWRGFVILRQSLFLSCCQDIAKLSTDSDDRTPSIRNLLIALSDERIRSQLRDRFAAQHAPLAEPETDPEILEALRQMDLREEAENRKNFDSTYTEAVTRFAVLESSPTMAAFRTVRDKVSAHTEIRFVADKYQLVDIASLGLKWGDLKTTIAAMQHLVAALGLLVRGAGFAWEMLDEQLSSASIEFWLPRSDA